MLILHVELLYFYWSWGVSVHILHSDQRPGEVVAVVDALEPQIFGWQPHCGMEILDRALQAWELIYIVDCLPCCMVVIESLDVINY